MRGTSNLVEMLQDVSLFVEVGLFESFKQQIIYYGSYIEGVINADVRAEFDDPVIQYAEAYLSRLESGCSFSSSSINNWSGPTTLYFAGHSLGGGISEIVAANLQEHGGYKSHIQSFGVCSPGVLLSSAKFGFGVEALDKTSSSLLPRRDFVSMVDEHGGNIQYTDCDAESAASCHLLDNALCELFYGCPDDLASGNKKKWIMNFCEASANSTDDSSPTIGASILNIDPNATLTDIGHLSLDQIEARQCELDVYDFCAEATSELEDSCNTLELGEWDWCGHD